jgi:hypothetical protein
MKILVNFRTVICTFNSWSEWWAVSGEWLEENIRTLSLGEGRVRRNGISGYNSPFTAAAAKPSPLERAG